MRNRRRQRSGLMEFGCEALVAVQNNIPFWDIRKEDLSGMWSFVPETERVHQKVQGVSPQAAAGAGTSRTQANGGGARFGQTSVIRIEV